MSAEGDEGGVGAERVAAGRTCLPYQAAAWVRREPVWKWKELCVDGVGEMETSHHEAAENGCRELHYSMSSLSPDSLQSNKWNRHSRGGNGGPEGLCTWSKIIQPEGNNRDKSQAQICVALSTGSHHSITLPHSL